ncbi:hypothetical protein EJ994_09485 [Maribacter sp. MJ134]|uniref:hypothetical protein n=1 Tax=Maribacter sp. MJ134 TaxID=2496865 RepID=UPI000F82DA08|nr:hypothetical protein [Maribacter sp. MJ134]AZQ59028.1 hypothetical protein EJ994_09485 [Maribacter sp. MJ134]
MKLWRRFFNFYLDASIHVALAVFSLVYVTGITLNIPIDFNLSCFIFFGTIVCYNFIKYGVEASKYVLVANPYHKNIQILSFLAGAGALYHAFFLNEHAWYLLFFLSFMILLYALPLLPSAKNLRSLGGLKIFVVAVVWAMATVLLPYFSVNEGVSWDAIVETVQRFLLVLILLIPFEIRDLKYDSPTLKTLPQRYGVANTKIIGAFLTLVFFFITFFKDDINRNELLVKGVLFLGLGCLMYTTKRNQTKYYASFWVEAVPILWLVILLFMEKRLSLV